MPRKLIVISYWEDESPPPLPADFNPIRDIRVAIRQFHLKELSRADHHN